MRSSAMLNPPGSSSARAPQRSNRRKTQENPDDVMRQLQRLPPNKKCADCTSKLPQSVNLTVGTFVCMTCSGVLRELNHRVKGMGHSSFTAEEVEQMKKTNNDLVNEKYLARYSFARDRLKAPTDNNDPQLLKIWIRRKYHDKAWYSIKGAEPQPTVVQVPPAAKQEPAQDLLAFDTPAPAPATTPTAPSEWDAFGGNTAAPAAPTSPAFQANFASFGQQNPSQGALQQQQQQQQMSNTQGFANFSSPQAQAAPQPPQQNGFANFPTQQQPTAAQPNGPNQGSFPQTQQPAPNQAPTNFNQQTVAPQQQPPQQQPPQQQHGFANFGQQQPTPHAPAQQQNFATFPQGGGVAQPPLQSPQTQNFATFQQTAPAPQQGQALQQQAFASFPQPNVQNNQQGAPMPPGQMPSQGMPQGVSQQAFGSFQQQQQPSQQQPPNALYQQQQQMPHQTSQQQPPRALPQQQQMQQPPPQQATHGNFQQPPIQQQGFQQPHQQIHPQTAPPPVPQFSTQQAPANVEQQQTQPPAAAASLGPPNQSPAAPAVSDASVASGGMSVSSERQNAFDAFSSLSVEPTASTGQDAPVREPKKPVTLAHPKQPVSSFKEGQVVIYKSSGGRTSVASIAKVHFDDELEPFYTIKLSDGKEKQTDDAHLVLPDASPIRDEIINALLLLSPEELKQVQEFVASINTTNSANSATPTSSQPPSSHGQATGASAPQSQESSSHGQATTSAPSIANVSHEQWTGIASPSPKAHENGVGGIPSPQVPSSQMQGQQGLPAPPVYQHQAGGMPPVAQGQHMGGTPGQSPYQHQQAVTAMMPTNNQAPRVNPTAPGTYQQPQSQGASVPSMMPPMQQAPPQQPQGYQQQQIGAPVVPSSTQTQQITPTPGPPLDQQQGAQGYPQQTNWHQPQMLQQQAQSQVAQGTTPASPKGNPFDMF